MGRVAASGWFLGWTAACSAVAVGFTSWLADGSSTGIRLLAVLLGLAAAAVVMLLVAWTAATPAEPRAQAAPVPPPPPVEAPTVVTPPAPSPAPRHDALATILSARIGEGERLREQAEPARVDAWIAGTHALLQRERPGVAGYFGALARRPYADDAQRLDAHLARLRTIVRDMV